ncbi:hypothetical protein MHAS44199_23005 [Mycolicibacterium hassiacum DSM 44199]|nr:hypothetical protein [Mycolicibacterium hassiacum DSM 44199]
MSRGSSFGFAVYQFHTVGSVGGYSWQTSVAWATTPLLLKNSFAQ